MASSLQGGCGGSEQHSKQANHHVVRRSATGAKTAIYRPDEKTTGTTTRDGGGYSGQAGTGELSSIVDDRLRI